MTRMLIFVIAFLSGVSSTSLQAQSCTELAIDDAIQRGHELTTLLKIANFRGDVKYMGRIALELEAFLETCTNDESGLLALVCDYDCHLQLGRYKLFQASALPLLSTAGVINRNDIIKPVKAKEFADEGLEIVERGLKFLARQQGGGSNNDQQEASYRNFVHQLVGLNTLKIQLHMAAGDTWYQTVSEARVKRLDFLLSEALNTAAGLNGADQSNLSKAYTEYEEAFWTLLETKMDVPDESTYNDLDLDLLLLKNDLQKRMESVRKGYLFLNIDPLQFTTIPFEKLKERLSITLHDLKGIEDKIASIVENWHAKTQSEATRKLDEQRIIRSQEINLVAHQIGKIEHEAQEFANTVKKEINIVDAERDSFGFRQQIRNLEIQLERKIAQFENRRKQINSQSELDLIALAKEGESERRNELRWLLSFEMTRMNLDLQISSIETQLKEYKRQVERNKDQSNQLSHQQEILQIQIENAEAGIIQVQENIANIEKQQTDIFAKRRAVMREEICGIESQLAFFGKKPDAPFTPLLAWEEACQNPARAFNRAEYVANMCGANGEVGLREKLFNEQIRARAFVLQCVVGDTDFTDLTEMVGHDQIIVDGSSDNPTLPDGIEIDCGKFDQTEETFAKQIWKTEVDLFEQKAESFEETRKKISEQIDFVKNWSRNFNLTVSALEVGVTTAESAYAALASVPEQTVAAAGLASGLYTTIKTDKPALAALESLRYLLTNALRMGQIESSTKEQIKALELQLTQIQDANEQINYQKALKAIALHRTHFQLAGRRAEGLNQIKELTLQNSIAGLECQNQNLEFDSQVARLQAEHSRLLASMDLQASENDLLSFQLATQNRQIERYKNEIEILRLDQEKLKLSKDQLDNDNKQLDDLIAAAEKRKARVEATQGIVDGLAEESQQVSNVIKELGDRQKKKMLALSQDELTFVESRIAKEPAQTEELVAGLKEAIELGLKKQGLQDKILTFQEEVLADVKERQEELIKLVSRQKDDPADRHNLFIANQETVAGLMKGIPEYIIAKRRALERANRLLHLMRRRYAVVQAATGVNEDGSSKYVWNATQLKEFVDDIDYERFFNENQLYIDIAKITVPSNSGFVRKLALTKTVEFEVSPFAASEELMRENGYFTLWNNTFSARRNMTLIDIIISVQYRCTGGEHWNRFALTHSGSGMVFRPLTEGSDEVSVQVLIGPARSNEDAFWNVDDSLDEATVNGITSYWRRRFQVRTFPHRPGPPNDDKSLLPYLGAPVLGTYRLSLKPSSCSFDGANLSLYFIFASKS